MQVSAWLLATPLGPSILLEQSKMILEMVY